jgi:PKD repeat protein
MAPSRVYIFIIGIILTQCTKTSSTPPGPPPPPGDSSRFHNYLNLSPVLTAVFHYSAVGSNFHAPAAFDFTSTSSHANKLDWDFGDSSAHDNTINPVHTYAAPGNYRIILTAQYLNQVSRDTQHITVLDPLYSGFTIDSIHAQIWGGPRMDTVFFKVIDSAKGWQSENFYFPPTGGDDSLLMSSFSFGSPYHVPYFLNGCYIQVWDNYLNPLDYVYRSRGEYGYIIHYLPPPDHVPNHQIISATISPANLVGYPTILENLSLDIGGNMSFTVYITWR